MNKSYTIDELISGYYENELLKAEDIPLPRFSLKHRIRMNRIFRQFSKNRRSVSNKELPAVLSTEAVHKPLTLRKRLLIAALIIILLAFVTGFVIMFRSNGFEGIVYNDNTHLFAINTEGCPPTIERVYVLSVVPEGYELIESSTRGASEYTLYRNPQTNQELIFKQWVKSEYNAHINTEGYELRETEINGCNAVCIDFTDEKEIGSMVIWEDQDYILELNCDFGLDESLKLAQENAINGF